MLKSFEKLSENSSIWIFQAERILTEPEKSFISNSLASFIANWDSHGSSVCGSFLIHSDRFIIVASENANDFVSGCSKDKLVHTIQNLEKELVISLMDRNIVYIDGNNIESGTLKKIKNMLSDQILTPETLIFDTSIQYKALLSSHFVVPLSNSFLQKFIPSPLVQN
jgi:hypothetical protein